MSRYCPHPTRDQRRLRKAKARHSHTWTFVTKGLPREVWARICVGCNSVVWV